MYSPYAEQSIAGILYVLLTFVLLIANSKRHSSTTMGVWICKNCNNFSYGLAERIHNDVSPAVSRPKQLGLHK